MQLANLFQFHKDRSAVGCVAHAHKSTSNLQLVEHVFTSMHGEANVPATSPKPPVFDQGATSADTNTIFRGLSAEANAAASTGGIAQEGAPL